jgi:hypothetical protein
LKILHANFTYHCQDLKGVCQPCADSRNCEADCSQPRNRKEGGAIRSLWCRLVRAVLAARHREDLVPRGLFSPVPLPFVAPVSSPAAVVFPVTASVDLPVCLELEDPQSPSALMLGLSIDDVFVN